MLASKFFANTTFHAPPLASLAKNVWMRVFWWCITVLGIAAVLGTSWQLLATFTSSTLVTVVSVVSKDQLQMPNITLCSMTRINKSALIKSGYWQLDPYLHIKLLMLYYNPYSTALYGPDAVDLPEDFNNITYDPLFLYSLIRNVSFDCGSFLHDTFLLGPQHLHLKNWGKCFESHNGPCFALVTEDIYQKTPGPKGGISFQTRRTPAEDIVNDTIFNSFPESGIQLFTTPEDSKMERSPILVPFNSRSKIALSPTRTTLLPSRPEGCTPNKIELDDSHYFAHYSSRRCQIECMLDFMKSICGCYMFTTYLDLPEDELCDPYLLFECFSLDRARKERLHQELAVCRQDRCQDTCDHWRYSTTVSNAPYISAVYEQAYNETFPHLWSNGGLTLIEIYFNDIHYTQITERAAVTPETFISNIGGNFGLYTGGSLVTIVHLFFHMLSTFVSYCKQRRRDTDEAQARENIKTNDTSSRPSSTVSTIRVDLQRQGQTLGPQPGFNIREYKIPRPKFNEYLVDGNFILHYNTNNQ